MEKRSLAAVLRLHQEGRLSEAAHGYSEILIEEPDNADAIHLLGVIRFQTGDLDAAGTLVRRAIALNGMDVRFHANLGRIEKARGELPAAIIAYRHALTLLPDAADVHSDLAAALADQEEWQSSLDHADRALAIDGRYAAAAFNRGVALRGMGQQRAAVAAFETAVQCDPTFANGYFELARLHQQAGQNEAARQAYRKSLSLDPALHEARCNLGNILRAEGQLESALSCYNVVLDAHPDLAEVHCNKGVTLQEMGDRDAAIDCYRHAIFLQPNDAEAHRNLSMALLQGGQFEEGWQEFEWRWQTRHFARIRRNWQKPQWQGQMLSGETVLVHAEQGFGDSFQFCRYIPLIVGRGGRVVVEVPDPVREVIQTVGGVSQMVVPGAAVPDFDFHVPMMSLPGAFRTTAADIPAPRSYLSVPPRLRNTGSDRPAIKAGRKRIGIVWKGSSEHARNLWRSPGIDVFRPLLTVGPADFCSLQKDDGSSDLKSSGLFRQIDDRQAGMKTFAETAALIDHLDLVITPDTAVAHLSSAMGCQTWILLPYVAEWRWGMVREDCPWYPSARLFRQSAPGDWTGVITRVREALIGFVRR